MGNHTNFCLLHPEIERRKINGELVGGLVDGLGNLGGSIISLFDKRDAGK